MSTVLIEHTIFDIIKPLIIITRMNIVVGWPDVDALFTDFLQGLCSLSGKTSYR